MWECVMERMKIWILISKSIKCNAKKGCHFKSDTTERKDFDYFTTRIKNTTKMKYLYVFVIKYFPCKSRIFSCIHKSCYKSSKNPFAFIIILRWKIYILLYSQYVRKVNCLKLFTFRPKSTTKLIDNQNEIADAFVPSQTHLAVQ